MRRWIGQEGGNGGRRVRMEAAFFLFVFTEGTVREGEKVGRIPAGMEGNGHRFGEGRLW